MSTKQTEQAEPTWTDAALNAILAYGQVKLAADLGMSVDNIKRWMRNGRVTPVDNVLRVAALVNLPRHEFEPRLFAGYSIRDEKLAADADARGRRGN